MQHPASSHRIQDDDLSRMCSGGRPSPRSTTSVTMITLLGQIIRASLQVACQIRGTTRGCRAGFAGNDLCSRQAKLL
jgi:hypothetical protein